MLLVLQNSYQDVWLFMTSAFLSIFSMQCYADISVFDAKTDVQIDGGYMAVASKFGPPFPADGFDGMIMAGVPETGCSQLNPPNRNNQSNFTRKWIVLLKRGECNFDVKVRNAQEATFDMAIVYNNSSEIIPMRSNNGSDISILSVFVAYHTGKELRQNYQYYNNVYVLIEDDSTFPFDINADLLIPFGVVVAVCFITMISFMICKCIRDRRRARRHRLPTSSLRKIPIEKFSKGSPFETCAICLDDYVEGEKLRVLPCQHAYHTKCIDPWLTRNRRVCPICKRKVFAADELPHEGSESDSDTDNDERTPLVGNDPSTAQQRQTRSGYLRALARHDLFAPISSFRRNSENSQGTSEASSSRSGDGAEGTLNSILARIVNSVNSTDDDSILDQSVAGSLYSYNCTGRDSINALQLPQNSDHSDTQSHTNVSITSAVDSFDSASDQFRNV